MLGDSIPLDATHALPNDRSGRVPQLAESRSFDDVVAVAANEDANDNAGNRDQQAASYSMFSDNDFRAFESSWLARRLEKEDQAA